jgi:phosphoribosylformimino-5-aminoimidazole carboxamide ribotide isomerase
MISGFDPVDFQPVDFQSMVGVIDLKQGKAVAASGGHRDRYEPIASIDGQADRLLNHYAFLGIKRTYIADLDAIVHDRPQIETLRSLVCDINETAESLGSREIWIDVGMRAGITPWMFEPEFEKVNWIVASETCSNVRNFPPNDVCNGVNKLAISLDFQGSHFLGEQLTQWIDLLAEEIVSSAIVLNLSDVGSQSGGSMDEVIIRIREQCPNLRLFAGGGVRDANDLNRLKSYGCDGVLVATAIRP